LKTKVLVALPNDILGGAELFLKSIAVAYSAKGYSVSVYFITGKRSEGWDDLKHIVNLNYGKGNSETKGILPFVYNLIKARNTSFHLAISSHVHVTGVIGFLRRTKILNIQKFIGRESTSIFTRFTGLRLQEFRLMYQMGYPALDLLICQTHFMKEQLEKGIPNLSKKIKQIEVLPNPINLEDSMARSAAAPEIPVDPAQNYIVAAGRMINEKGFDLLIKAFNSLYQHDESLRLLILGEGELRPQLEALINALNLKEKVLLPGRVKNVYPYFKIAQLCIVSSRVEGFPNVLLQMMSQNGNVISSTCAGDIDTIPSLPTFIPNNVDAMKQTMRENLYLDATAINSRYTVFDCFLKERSLDKFIERLENL
jgi:glycosyltransferase involved in cell wall biosynthesis